MHCVFWPSSITRDDIVVSTSHNGSATRVSTMNTICLFSSESMIGVFKYLIAIDDITIWSMRYESFFLSSYNVCFCYPHDTAIARHDDLPFFTWGNFTDHPSKDIFCIWKSFYGIDSCKEITVSYLSLHVSVFQSFRPKFIENRFIFFWS